jgi:DNA-binding CsgD family transcriptional regulator
MRPIYVRELSAEERETLRAGLKSKSAFTMRRSQILLHSAEKKSASEIAKEVHCSEQTVRNALYAFEQEGLFCLREKSHARHDQKPAFSEAGVNRLKEIIRLSPRLFGHETSLWTRELLAETCSQEGLTPHRVSKTLLTDTMKAAGIEWRRARKWIRSPDPAYELRKKDAID